MSNTGEEIQNLVERIESILVARGDDEQEIFVEDVLSTEEIYSAHREAMEQVGVALSSGRQGKRRRELAAQEYVFLDWVKLRKTFFAHVERIDLLLLKMEGAKRAQYSIAGRRESGIRVPLDHWRAWSETAKCYRARLLAQAPTPPRPTEMGDAA